MSTSLHIFSPDPQTPSSESRFTQAAPSNKADASNMSRPFNFLLPVVVFTMNRETSLSNYTQFTWRRSYLP